VLLVGIGMTDEKDYEEISFEEVLKDYEKAGKIANEALEKAVKLVKPGAVILNIAEETEEFIRKSGAEPAFPANFSVNNYAAHFTPAFDDKTVFGEKDVVKVDVGAHVNGFIGDNARTVDLSCENAKLVEASEKALEEALSCIKVGKMSNEIGKIIGGKIESYGFKPVENLCGHVLDSYEMHTGLSLPNTTALRGFELEENMFIAVEPFASTGEGFVKEDVKTEIFSLEASVPTRNLMAREIIDFAAGKYMTLPFAERWLAKEFPSFQLKIALRELVRSGSFRAYPMLKDISGSLVSQAEKTIVVEKDGCKVLTK